MDRPEESPPAFVRPRERVTVRSDGKDFRVSINHVLATVTQHVGRPELVSAGPRFSAFQRVKWPNPGEIRRCSCNPTRESPLPAHE